MARFYLDHNVSLATAAELRLRRHQATTARDLGLERASDAEQLLAAVRLGAILVTHNAKDFILLNDAWNRWALAWQVNARHGGIIVTPDIWLEPQEAGELSDFLVGGYPLFNRIYAWQPRGGWVAK
ncbi:MAG TPA: DUF5615 family PIN-like protein [Thermomicrobiaceae bacterium]|nr:DUF5615 family PIN-like protein [Thermomicrobiaceae bacterium]